MEGIDLEKVEIGMKLSAGRNADRKQADENDLQLLQVFGEGLLSEAPLPGSVSAASQGSKRIQSHILAEMLAIDPERALTSMKSWATFV